MRAIRLLTTLIVIVCVAGCSPVQFAGKLSGSILGAKVAKALPAPKAHTVINPQGGRFCPTMHALGWPGKVKFNEAMIAVTPGPTAGVIADTLDYGDRHCPEWKR